MYFFPASRQLLLAILHEVIVWKYRWKFAVDINIGKGKEAVKKFFILYYFTTLKIFKKKQ